MWGEWRRGGGSKTTKISMGVTGEGLGACVVVEDLRFQRHASLEGVCGRGRGRQKVTGASRILAAEGSWVELRWGI